MIIIIIAASNIFFDKRGNQEREDLMIYKKYSTFVLHLETGTNIFHCLLTVSFGGKKKKKERRNREKKNQN